MNSISARDANQAFSKLLKRAEDGEEVVITKHGRPVARLVPVESSEKKAERAKAHERLMKRLRKGVDMGGRRFTRDEMHER